MNEAKSDPAVVRGEAAVVRKNSAQAQPAVLHMTVEITRAATGKVEIYQIVGTPIPETKEA
jgi:hypothetical protein